MLLSGISIYRDGKQIQLTNKEVVSITCCYNNDFNIFENLKDEFVTEFCEFAVEQFAEDTHNDSSDMEDNIESFVRNCLNNDDGIIYEYASTSNTYSLFKAYYDDIELTEMLNETSENS